MALYSIPKKNKIPLVWQILICSILFISELQAQTVWVKAIDNPVLIRDTVISNFPNDLIAISDCWVIKEGTTYKMWYTAGGFNFPTDTLLRSRICYATSMDGLHWDKYAGNPILDVSYDGLWDSLGVETVSIIYDSTASESERYKMWYAGQYFNSYRYDIGYAFSADGINWTKHSTPVLQVGSESEWDNGFLEGTSVIWDGAIFKMWYCGYDAIVDGNDTDGKANIGFATSDDGITWTKYAGNPVLSTEMDAWDSYYVQDPHVIYNDEIYYMWYGGNDVEGFGQQVGFATSDDGITWTKSDLNPVLTRGGVDDWDANTASFPAIIKGEDKYEMWYTGKDIAEILPDQLDYFWEIGYASSTISNTIAISNADDNLIHISPNPCKDNLHIKITNELSRVTLTIFNQMGEMVLEKFLINDESITIDTQNFSVGIYSLVVSDINSKTHVKFLKLD
ncbi:MAG: T9SS type A sorting domain-containing protein [Bacteroidetes bacterium]|nr:T9SS type A sorting domain-containing protein [Bacteroidota bacterium]MBP7399408.1 T9SS type A sorting domain-containing protein [Chitinophagales bacterium]MBP9119447.1 T9SS type A sorting domain-containing protein [Ignavibacterium sp.]MBP8755368.1 T9SS type A sorting domain-containing protein [Chitinophagales bacterium]MBP9188051.1 T9SS type A sorting domain-containing protein [Chitinophagales bacterium]